MSDDILTNRSVGKQGGNDKNLQKSTRDCLIEAASQLFTEKGYHGTSILDIVSACNITKASLFHYFEGKQELALETIHMIHQQCKEHIFKYVYDSSLSPKERSEQFLTATETYFITHKDCSLPSFIGSELVNVISIFNAPIQEFFAAWRNTIHDLLSASIDGAKASRIAQNSLIYIQGSLIMRRIDDDENHIIHMCRHLRELWHN